MFEQATMKKKPKKNTHCPVAGCRATKPHLSSATTAGIHHAFSNPEQLALWIKSCLVELAQSVIDDVNKGRYFAYLTRWRQPEEMYHRALYMLFVADKSELPHIASGELPNSFSQMWKEVNRVVYDGRGTLDQKQLGLNGEEFTAMNTLNNSAHASLATVVTCIDFSKNRELRRPIVEKLSRSSRNRALAKQPKRSRSKADRSTAQPSGVTLPMVSLLHSLLADP